MRVILNCFILTLLTILPIHSYAQTSAKNSMDTLHQNEVKKQLEPLVMPEGLDMSFNGLLNQWYEKKTINSSFTEDSVNPFVSDSTVIKRLSQLPTIMELPFNEHVRKCIDFYTGQRRKQVSYMLAMGQYYMPIFEDQLIANKLPNELKYLPIIESALNPTAYSRAGAGGLWQLMVATGRIYGLQVNSLIDERMDPYKATVAAARYLKDLFRIYGDWNLVIAAYNCGPGNVNKAIRRSGGKRDYWQIYPYLPTETRNYVPIFIAANYVMNYYKEHNLSVASVCLPMSDTIMVKEKVHLMQIADLMNLPIAELRTLNPQYRQDVVPGNFQPCAIRLPLDAASSFLQNKDKIVAYKADELFTNRLLVEPSEKVFAPSSKHKAKGSKSRKGKSSGHSSSKKKTSKSSGTKHKKHR
jgi:membrane-bound lytic murein transglycosylase D